ncbi:hypothetical protein [Pleomorphovibrio marinus]|nr:hypothetical protein [Pleomorphovibrio marinus]
MFISERIVNMNMQNIFKKGRK